MRITSLILAGIITICPAAVRAEGQPLSPLQQQFMSFAHMNPMQRLHAQALQSVGYSEQQLAAMSPDQRKPIQKQVVKIIQDHIGQ